METIAKKGEWVKIVDFGISKGYYDFAINKPYQLLKDLNQENGFVSIDNEGDYNRYINDFGYINAFELNMKFEKVEPMEDKELTYKVTREQLKQLHDKVHELYKEKMKVITGSFIPIFENECILKEEVVNTIWLYISIQHNEAIAIFNEIFPKPKKKVTKEISRWATVDVNGETGYCYNTKEQAENTSSLDKNVVQVELKGTYEVEE